MATILPNGQAMDEVGKIYEKVSQTIDAYSHPDRHTVTVRLPYGWAARHHRRDRVVIVYRNGLKVFSLTPSGHAQTDLVMRAFMQVLEKWEKQLCEKST